MIGGGCFCGAIRYELESDRNLVVNCHCRMCRKTSAAPFVTWMIVAKEQFRYTRGEPKTLLSSDKGTRFFCAGCGTPLAFESRSRTAVIDITVGSLDTPEAYPPTAAAHEDSKLPWLGQTETRKQQVR